MLIGEDPVLEMPGQPNIAGREMELQRLQEQIEGGQESERAGEEADEPQYTEQRQLKEDSGSEEEEEEQEGEVSYRDDKSEDSESDSQSNKSEEKQDKDKKE